MKRSYLNRFLQLLLASIAISFSQKGFSQVPNIYYSGAQSFPVNAPITPVTPANIGGAVISQVSTFAGNTTAGATDASGASASFSHPMGLAMDATGNIYVADRTNNKIRKISPSGNVITLAGSGTAGFSDGYGTSAYFNSPNSVAVDAAGNIYVADEGNQRIRKIDASGNVSTYAGTGTSGFTNSSSPTSATFSNPYGVAIDASGNVYVADEGNGAVRKIAANGTVSTLASGFTTVLAVATDAAGNVYAADAGSQEIYQITPTGVYGAYGTGGSFNHPAGLAVDRQGNVIVGDQLNAMVRKIIPLSQLVSTLAGSGSQGSSNGPAGSASFYYPIGVVADNNGNVFVADYGNNMIREISGSFSISPALPAGLVFDAQTGTISGTPTAISPATTYTVTATNASGQGTTTISISVHSSQAINQSQNQNYVITYTPRTAINDITNFSGATVDQVNQSIQYFDGLGRSMQTVVWQGSPNRNDMVQPIAYDQFGREVTQYLPYANNPTVSNDGSYKTDAISTQQPAFYGPSTWTTNVVQTSYPIAGTAYEPSPLNRVVEKGEQGTAWQIGNGHTNKVIYAVNDGTTYWAKQFAVSIDPATGIRSLVDQGNYTANKLYVTVSQDENWLSSQADLRLNTTEEYKDNGGNVVLKRTYNSVGGTTQILSTYYVYDDLGSLSFVLPPGANADASTATSPIAQPILDNICYQYRYDQRHRLVQKKLPGKGWDFTIYNRADQAIMTQDANQRNQSPQQWSFIKYDALGRTIITGTYAYPGSSGDSNLGTPDQTEFNWLQNYASYQTNLWEVRDNTTSTGYSNQAAPQGTTVPLSISYYDDYNIAGLPTAYVNTSANTITQGLLTASRVAVLNNPGDMLWTVNYYDNMGREIQTYKQHYLASTPSISNYDVISNTYNLVTNELTNTTRQHFTIAGGATPMVTIADIYVYDHVGRKRQTQEQINSGPNIVLSQLDYNEIGQVKTKHLHSNGGVNFLQDINYSYNERGWLTQSSAQLFTMQLKYNDGTSPQYNGNISNQLYGSSAGALSSYTYSYDALNHLTGGMSNDGFGEQNITYDIMGNITSLNRVNGLIGLNATYSYSYNYNQLSSVSGLTTGNYNYDPNGNVYYDARTGKNITYNMLNLPQAVTSSGFSLTYTYDATGNKLKKNNGTVVTDYISGIQYDNNTISFIQTEEGRAIPTGSPSGNSYNYEYSLTDNLGNARVTFDTQSGSANVVQHDDYMPFGMEVVRGTIPSPKNENLFNKKELQEETGQYDFGARFYDPVVTRFNAIDAYAEQYVSLNPYQYGALNPVKNVDINGDSIKVKIYWTLDLSMIGGGVSNQVSTVYYKDGTIYNQDGTKYNGTDPFALAVGKALDKISAGGDGKDMVDGIENSTHTTQILSRKSDDGIGNRTTLQADGIFWGSDDRAGGPDTKGNLDRDPYIGLAHELGHVEYILQLKGVFDFSGDWFTAAGAKGPTPNSDKYATFRENQVRAEHGVPLREYYTAGEWESQIIDRKGNNIWIHTLYPPLSPAHSGFTISPSSIPNRPITP